MSYFGILVSCLAFSGVTTYAAQTITFPAVVPASIPVNQRSTVTVTAQISDPSLIADSVNFQRYDGTARVFQVLGSMFDDGTHGDARAGDGFSHSPADFS